MGRTKRFHEYVNLSLPAGCKARMDAALKTDEDRLTLIRQAIERELRRRSGGRRARKPRAANG